MSIDFKLAEWGMADDIAKILTKSPVEVDLQSIVDDITRYCDRTPEADKMLRFMRVYVEREKWNSLVEEWVARAKQAGYGVKNVRLGSTYITPACNYGPFTELQNVTVQIKLTLMAKFEKTEFISRHYFSTISGHEVGVDIATDADPRLQALLALLHDARTRNLIDIWKTTATPYNTPYTLS